MIKLLVVSAVLLVGCADLETFGAECGNFEIDPGEDCDEGADGTSRCEKNCRLTCDEQRTCHGFADYACGADGYCRAPSGKLASSFSELPTLARSFGITDVNRDYYGDVVAVSRTSLTVNYGDSSAALTDVASSLVPTLRGLPTFTDIDNDAAIDVVFPTADGVAAYSSPYQSLSPHPFILDLGDPELCAPEARLGGEPFHVFPLDSKHLGLLVSRDDGDAIGSNNKLGVAVISHDSKSVCGDPFSAQQVCNITVGDMKGAGMAGNPLLFGVADYDTSTALQASRVIAFTSGLPNGGACVIEFVRNINDPYFTSTRIFESPQVTRPVVLAVLDASGCPSVVDTISFPALGPRAYMGQGVPGACQVQAVPRAIRLPPGSFAVGSARIDPLSGVPPHAPDAIVTTDAVVAIHSDLLGYEQLYTSDRTLTAAFSADLDADGDLDLIAGSRGDEDVDVIQRVGDNFLLLRLDTAGAVTHLVVGDYDGNEIPDIAYAELFIESQRLNIAYGTRDRPLTPVDVGAFRDIVGLIRTQTPDSTDPDQIIDDLIVLDIADPMGGQPSLTLLHGSPQRTMQSYFDPRKGNLTPNPSDGIGSVFTGIATGQFFPTSELDPAASQYSDMIAIDGSRTGPATLWPVEGTAYGVYSYTKQVQSGTSLGSCAGPTAPGFCTDTALYTTWSREPSNDVVIGIDNARTGRHMVVIDPLDPGIGTDYPNATISISAFPISGPAIDGLDVRSISSGDLDGDGQRELIVAFGPENPDAKQGAIVVCSVNGDGVPVDCTDLVAQLPPLAGLGCVDATVAKITPARPPGPPLPVDLPGAQPLAPQDLVVVCHDDLDLVAPEMQIPGRPETLTLSTLFRVHHDGSAFRADVLGTQIGSIERLQAGDVTGDGLDDIVGLRINRTSGPSLVIIPQCASNDAQCSAEFVALEEPAR